MKAHRTNVSRGLCRSRSLPAASLAALAFLTLIHGPAPGAQSGPTTRESVDSLGQQAWGDSFYPSLSADGRWIAFTSEAADLVPGDTNGTRDVFLRDRLTGKTERVNLSSQGVQANYHSGLGSVSADGRFVCFDSWADNLVPGDTNICYDVFVRDRLTGQTTRVSVDSAGRQGRGASYVCAITPDGRFVAFGSDAPNLVPGDTNGYRDIFVHDRRSGETRRVSVDSAGREGNRWSDSPSISADGRFVAFMSDAEDLVPRDLNGREDVFVHDLRTARTTRVSVDSTGNEGDHISWYPEISADGRCVTFGSLASNLVPGDTNGHMDIFVHDRLTGLTTRVNVDSSGAQANDRSDLASISADGRYVAFDSEASNLVPHDTNGRYDVFVHDRRTGETFRVSVDSMGFQANHLSWWGRIAPDGSCVAFHSYADNLVPGDTNDCCDAFVREL